MKHEEFHITGIGRDEIIARRSRFIGIAFFVDDGSTVKDLVRGIRDEHAGAAHVCYAFQIGIGNTKLQGLSDDGEPKGTAGRPILEVLKGSGVTDCCITVVRYFGGVLLGTGGLARAYASAAHAALNSVRREIIVSRETLKMRIAYEYYQKVMDIIVAASAADVREEFAEQVSITAMLPEESIGGVIGMVRDITKGSALIE